MVDWILRGARLIDALRDEVADIAVDDGKIVAIAKSLAEKAEQEFSGEGLVLFAGGIDPHVHFNEPGRAEWEGLATGSKALAKGGYTSFFDMPLNSTPPITTVTAYDAKRALADKLSIVNSYLWGGLTPNNLNELLPLHERGVIAFKAFMSNSGIDDFQAVDDYSLYRGMQIIAPTGKILAVHAENDSLTGQLAANAIHAGRIGVKDYLRSRPAVAELEAIQRAILFADETDCKLHIVHVSTGRGVALVLEAQERGVDVSCETCPHYLVFTEEDVERMGALLKSAPPIRPQEEQRALWRYLLANQLPMVVSDHSPAPMDLKQGGYFFKIWGGIASCQSTLQLLLTYGYRQRQMSLQQISAVTSYNVARRFGLHSKGRIALGMDADLTLIDVNQSEVLVSEALEYRHKVSPYVGMTLQGKVLKTWVGGKLVYG
jgi:allantoinase